MDCHDARPLIQDDLDGRLDDVQRERLAAHLEACAECREAATELRELRELFRAVPPVPAPAGFQESVMARVPRPRGRLLRLAPWLTAVAAAALVAVGIGQLSDGVTDVAMAPESAATAAQEDANYDEKSVGATRSRAPPLETEATADTVRPELEEMDDAAGTPSPDPVAVADADVDAPAPGSETGNEVGGRRGEGVAKGRGDNARDSVPPAPAEPAPRAPTTTAPAPASAPRPSPSATPGAADPGASKKSVALRRGLATAADAPRIVVFSDRGEAERFVTALRDASAAAGPPPPTAPGAKRPGARGPEEERSSATGASAGGASPERPDSGMAAADYVATAAASDLAEAAEAGNARVLLTLSVPRGSERVDALLRGVLEGRSWARPLSERLYARAVRASGRGGPTTGDAGEETHSGPVVGAGAGAGGGAGGGGGGAKSKDEGAGADAADQPAADDGARRQREAGKTAALEVIVLVLE